MKSILLFVFMSASSLWASPAMPDNGAVLMPSHVIKAIQASDGSIPDKLSALQLAADRKLLFSEEQQEQTKTFLFGIASEIVKSQSPDWDKYDTLLDLILNLNIPLRVDDGFTDPGHVAFIGENDHGRCIVKLSELIIYSFCLNEKYCNDIDVYMFNDQISITNRYGLLPLFLWANPMMGSEYKDYYYAKHKVFRYETSEELLFPYIRRLIDSGRLALPDLCKQKSHSLDILTDDNSEDAERIVILAVQAIKLLQSDSFLTTTFTSGAITWENGVVPVLNDHPLRVILEQMQARRMELMAQEPNPAVVLSYFSFFEDDMFDLGSVPEPAMILYMPRFVNSANKNISLKAMILLRYYFSEVEDRLFGEDFDKAQWLEYLKERELRKQPATPSNAAASP